MGMLIVFLHLRIKGKPDRIFSCFRLSALASALDMLVRKIFVTSLVQLAWASCKVKVSLSPWPDSWELLLPRTNIFLAYFFFRSYNCHYFFKAIGNKKIRYGVYFLVIIIFCKGVYFDKLFENIFYARLKSRWKKCFLCLLYLCLQNSLDCS
jgi:hypothetical protein